MTRYLLSVYLLLFLSLPAYAQRYPNYKERSFTLFTDTSKTMALSSFGSEGAINPDEYMIGPGDILFISISGLEETTFTIPVDNEGNIFIPKVGGLLLRNKTLAQTRESAIKEINKYYKDVDIFLTLAEYKKNKVALVGDVIKPASFILPGNARLLDLITVSSGLNSTSNYRNIEIKHNNGEVDDSDLLAFLRLGDKKQNPILQEGDIVIIDKVDKIVTVSGLVKYPGSYEYLANETVSDIINISGGLSSKARKDSIEIIRFDESGKFQYSLYYSYDQLLNNGISLMPQDHVTVRELSEFMIDRYVELRGYIKYPGWYKIIKDKTTLSEIIQEAGGFLEEAALPEAAILRNTGISVSDPEYERLKLIPRAEMTDDEYDYLKAKSRQRIGKVVVDFVDLFVNKNNEENIILVDGDIINIPRIKNYIIMLGQVINPGNIIYNDKYTYQDYINLAGGYGWRAIESEVRIIKANTGEWIYAEDVEKIEPGDAIWVPEDPPGPKFWDVFTTSLNILGQVAAVVAAVIAVIIASR